jgi:predicted Zn-dependent protease
VKYLARTANQSQSAQWLFCFAMFLIVGAITQSAAAAMGAAITVRLAMTYWVQWAVEKGAFEQ